MPNVDAIFDILTPEELDHIDAGRPAAFARSLAKRSGLATAAVVAGFNEVYAEIRRRLGYAE